MMVYLQSFSDIWNLPPVTRDVIKEICSKYCDTTWDSRKQEISCFCDKYEMSVEMEKKNDFRELGCSQRFLQVSCHLWKFWWTKHWKPMLPLKEEPNSGLRSDSKAAQNISMDKSVILLFLMLSLTLLHFFSLTPLSFAHLRSHTDIYFYREALPGTHSPVRSTCLMFILLLNHQSISIGCWAVSLEQ